MAEPEFHWLAGTALSGDLIGEISSVHQQAFTPGWSPEQFRQLLGTDGAFISLLTASDRLLSFALWQQQFETADLITVATAPAALCKGHASLLLESSVAELRRQDCGAVLLEVAATNTAAIRLYEGHGFSRLHTREGYYSGEDGRTDALVLQKILKINQNRT